MAPLESRPVHSADVVRAEASKRFETSERTPMGTMPLSVIWAGTQYPIKVGEGQGELSASKEKMKVVKPSIWRTPKPTVASPNIKPASPRSWRTVCGLKCKDVTQDKGVQLVRERANSTVTEVQREQPVVVKPRRSIAPEARPQVPKKRGALRGFKARLRLPSSYRPSSVSFLTGKYPVGTWRYAARTRFKHHKFAWCVKSKIRNFHAKFQNYRKQYF